MDLQVVFAFGLGVVLLFFLARLLFGSLRLVWRLLYNALLGGLLLWGTNFLGAYVDFELPINPVTALVAGFLGIPGVILLIVLQYLMKT